MKFEYGNIPEELKRLKQWVCWCGDKLPKNPRTGGNAMSNNPQTWGTFDEAVEAVKKYHFDGVGFVFANGYFGIDLDDCVDNEDFTDEFVDTLQSYAEYSQSGKGIHIICKGQLPPGSRRKGNVEMYQAGRYFIMTGNVYKGIVYPLRDCTETVKILHAKYLDTPTSVVNTKHVTEITLTDDEVIEKARGCVSGAAFQLLFQGHWQGIYPSQSEADLALCNHLAFWTQKKADQMDRIFRRSGLFRPKWDRAQSGSTYGAITIQKAIAGTTQVYSPEMDETKVVIGADGTKTQTTPRKEYPHNDTGNANRFVDLFGANLRYSYQNRQWLFWDGKKWQEDFVGEIKKLADLCIQDMIKQAFEYDDEEKKDALLKWANKTASSKVKTAMITEAQHLGNIPVLMEQFDRHPDLLNCQNGIINLRNGELMPHDPNAMMTKISFCEYDPDPDKKPVRWLQFLDEITDGDKELQRYIQKAVGYSLTGSIREQCMFFCYGTGQNGKTTFLDVISNIMGTYASHAQPETVMLNSKQGNSAMTDIARLKGARFVTTVEPNEGVKLNEGLIKQLTGGDKVTARFLYCREFEFVPEFKLWLGANHKPVIRGTDIGIWRRIRLIPFTVQIPDSKVDKGLKHKLKAELPQILRWAVEGCLMWLREGLDVPETVKKATEEYREEMDILAQFCETCIETDYGARTKASEIYDAYCHWTDENNEYKMSNTRFGKEFAKRFPEKIRLGDGLWYKNVKLTDYAKKLIRVTKHGGFNFYDSRKDIVG